MSTNYNECPRCGKVLEEDYFDSHDCVDAYGECLGGAQQITHYADPEEIRGAMNNAEKYGRITALREIEPRLHGVRAEGGGRVTLVEERDILLQLIRDIDEAAIVPIDMVWEANDYNGERRTLNDRIRAVLQPNSQP